MNLVIAYIAIAAIASLIVIVIGVNWLLRRADQHIREWHGPGPAEAETDDATRER